MRPASAAPIRLGSGHCCACAMICHHIGPIHLCDRHLRQTTSTEVPDAR